MKTKTYIVSVGTLLSGMLLTACTNEVEEAMTKLQTFGVLSPSGPEIAGKAEELNLHYQLYKDGKETLADYSYLPALIQLAVQGGKEIPASILADLVKAGANVNAKDNSGRTALAYALAAPSPSVSTVDFLLQNGADANMADHSLLLDCLDMENAEQGRVLMEKLLAAGAKLNPDKPGDTTPLIMAISCSKPMETIKFLIDKGADVNSANSAGITPLIAAELGGNGPELRSLLISAKADVNAVDSQGRNAAFYAVQTTGAGALQAYLDAGVDAAHTDKEGNTLESTLRAYLSGRGGDEAAAAQNEDVAKLRHLAFEQAVLKGSSEKTKAFDDVVMAYIKANSFVPVTDTARRAGDDFMKHYLAFQRGEESIKDFPLLASLLCVCAERNLKVREEEIKPFLDAGVNVDMVYDQHSALCYAAKSHNDTAVRMLVEKGANVHGAAGDENVEHPLWLAAWSRDTAIAKYLVEHGANPNAIACEVPLVALAYKRGDTYIADILWAAGADPNSTLDGNCKLVMLFAMHDDFRKHLPALLEHGADPNAKWVVNGEEMSALTCAVCSKDLNAVKALVEHGADLNYQTSDNKFSALMLAVAVEAESIADYLIRVGANKGLKCKQGLTAEGMAQQRNANKFLKILMNAAEEEAVNPGEKAAIKTINQMMGN